MQNPLFLLKNYAKNDRRICEEFKKIKVKKL